MKEINLSHKLIIMKKNMNHKKIIIIFSENDINGNLVDLELHP